MPTLDEGQVQPVAPQRTQFASPDLHGDGVLRTGSHYGAP